MVGKLPYLSDDHHYAITAVAATAAELDHVIEACIAHSLRALHLSTTADFILKQMNGDRYVGLLRQVFLDQIDIDADDIEFTFSQIARLRKLRNEILHWVYEETDDPELAKSVSNRPFREPHSKSRTAAEIAEVAEEMRMRIKDLVNWSLTVHVRTLQKQPKKF